MNIASSNGNDKTSPIEMHTPGETEVEPEPVEELHEEIMQPQEEVAPPKTWSDFGC